MVYDVIIVWAGAAWLFAGINLDKKLKKLILEKNDKPGIKVLLSGGERANVSNMDIEPERDYFTQNNKFLLSVFSKYNQWDIMSFFAENWVNIVEEDRSRLILESGDSKELLDCLLKNTRKNNCDLKLKQDVKSIIFNEQKKYFEIETESKVKYFSKQVIISSWGKSFAQVWTTWEGYNIAKSFWLDMVTPYRTLCGMSTKKDLWEVSGVSCNLEMKLFDKKNKKPIYQEVGPLLFTHFWVSGPIVHNVSNAIWEYLNSKPSPLAPLLLGEGEKEVLFEKYIRENLYLELTFDLDHTPKRLVKFFNLYEENKVISLDLQNWRSWKEAKATWGWIDTDELDNTMQTKKSPGLYFIGEVVDVTGKTWGFNLQWAWSSAFVCANAINKKPDF